ncbi:hypothetical protein TeGR_g9170, partial [Tetraparma gracilis]
CDCVNYYRDYDGNCQKCPAGSIAISDWSLMWSVCSDVLTDGNIQDAVNLWVTWPQKAQKVYGDITYW